MDLGSIWPVVGSVAVALITSFTAYSIARSNSRKDIQAAAATAEEKVRIAKLEAEDAARKTINDSFQLVVGALERRVESQEAESKRERDAWREQLREEREEFEKERKELTDQIVSLKNEVKRLNQTVIRLERELRRNDIELPDEANPEHTALLRQLPTGGA